MGLAAGGVAGVGASLSFSFSSWLGEPARGWQGWPLRNCVRALSRSSAIYVSQSPNKSMA